MNDRGKSYKGVVPKKQANKGGGAPRSAEPVEGRALTKGNSHYQNRARAQKREALHHAEARIRQVAESGKEVQLTTLWHHVYNIDRLREAYFNLKPKAAAGVDGETWQSYGRTLEDNLQDLSERLKRGSYKARPVLRVYIPKSDGRQRPIGIPALEDKSAKLVAIRVELRRRMHHPVPEVGRWLGSVLRGYYNYHAVPGNLGTLKGFRTQVYWMWRWILRRRSQRSKLTKTRMERLAKRWLPEPRRIHPYPDQRLRV